MNSRTKLSNALMALIALIGLVAISISGFTSLETATYSFQQGEFSKALEICESDILFYKDLLSRVVNDEQRFNEYSTIIAKTYLQAGDCYAQLGTKEQAIQQYRRSIYYARRASNIALTQQAQQKINRIQASTTPRNIPTPAPHTNSQESDPQHLHSPEETPSSNSSMHTTTTNNTNRDAQNSSNQDSQSPQYIVAISEPVTGAEAYSAHPQEAALPAASSPSTDGIPSSIEDTQQADATLAFQELLNKTEYTLEDMVSCMDASDYYVEQGAVDQALIYMNQALNIANQGYDSEILQEIYFRLAELYELKGDLAQALTYYDTTLQHLAEQEYAPKRGEILHRISMILIERQEYDRARRLLQHSLELSDQQPAFRQQALFALGMIHFRQQKYHQAVQIFGEHLEAIRDLDNPQAIGNTTYWLGLSYIQMGNLEAGRTYLLQSHDLLKSIASPDAEVVEQTIRELSQR